jgi:hypothetical protein
MRFFIRSILVILILMFAAPVFAGGGPKGNCKLLGSWIGYDSDGSAWWMSTADGQNASRGTLNLEVPGSKLFFDFAFSVTELRGSWVKTGKNTYDWTVVGFPYLEDTTTMLLAKLSGVDTVSKDCNTIYVTDVVMEFFAPNADINVDPPFFTDDFPDHAGHRILINLP